MKTHKRFQFGGVVVAAMVALATCGGGGGGGSIDPGQVRRVYSGGSSISRCPVQGEPFTLSASVPQCKRANNGYNSHIIVFANDDWTSCTGNQNYASTCKA